MNNIDLMNYWIESSDEDYNVMKVLYNNKKNSYCLFFGHLVIEKLLNIITRFNMSARYDDYKKEFQEKCTEEYTLEQIQNIEGVRLWLKNLLTTD